MHPREGARSDACRCPGVVKFVASRLGIFRAEMKRRKVWRVAAAGVLAAGLPIALVLAWASRWRPA